ncbi:MAG: hypothetical protein M3137_16240 [Actinomycetota bacterium]|nr:hypothetical protein [Actinomycetota bacterium]
MRDDTATNVRWQRAQPAGLPDVAVSDDSATAAACPVCAASFERAGRQRFCSVACRQSAWRSKRSAPIQPVVAKSDTVYACPDCDARYLGEQRCDACNTWCRRLGPGSLCPCCDEPISISELVGPDQFAQTVTAKTSRRR